MKLGVGSDPVLLSDAVTIEPDGSSLQWTQLVLAGEHGGWAPPRKSLYNSAGVGGPAADVFATALHAVPLPAEAGTALLAHPCPPPKGSERQQEAVSERQSVAAAVCC